MSFIDGVFAKKKTGNLVNITGCGFTIYIQSLYTFPIGFEIDEFADDRDPFDSPDILLGTYRPDLNGNLVFFNKPTPLVIDLYLPPGTSGEQNCRTLLNANLIANGKGNTDDLITMIIKYADGTTKIALNGRIVAGNPLQSVSNRGRIKSQHFQFVFSKPLN